MKNSNVLTLSILFFLIAATLSAQSDTLHREGLFIGRIELSSSLKGLSESKVEAAVNLAALATGKYYLISREARDSIYNKLKQAGERATVIFAARKLNAVRIVFIKINRIENMLRIDVQTVQTDSANTFRSGKGYANLWLRRADDQEIIYDPALLAAFQRAFADAEDPLMYASAPPEFNVAPAKTLVIGSIYYNDKQGSANWDIFKDKIVGSFEAVETVFEQAKISNRFVTYDTPSRDTIYALRKLYMLENYNYMSPAEIEALRFFNVDCFISGMLIGKGETAVLELSLYESNGESFSIIKTQRATLAKDSKKEYLELLQSLTKRLLSE